MPTRATRAAAQETKLAAALFVVTTLEVGDGTEEV